MNATKVLLISAFVTCLLLGTIMDPTQEGLRSGQVAAGKGGDLIFMGGRFIKRG